MANGKRKIQGLGNFCSNLEISESSVLNESLNLVFLWFFASRILELLATRSWSLGLLFLVNGLDQNHDKIVYLIKNVR